MGTNATAKPIRIPEGKRVIYVTGGSTGSHAINRVIFESIHDLLKEFIVIHQTGDSKVYKDFDKASELKENLPQENRKNYIYKKYISPEEIGYVLNRANIIVSRSGANTVNEILTLGKKSILIPLPQGQENEQLENARIAQKQGFAIVLRQDYLTKESLLVSIKEAIELLPKKPIDTYSKDAGKNIYSVIKNIYEQNKKKKS